MTPADVFSDGASPLARARQARKAAESRVERAVELLRWLRVYVTPEGQRRIDAFLAEKEAGREDEVERVEWKHGCDVICGYVTFWWPTVIACPHCGMPNPHAESARRGAREAD